MFVVIALIVKSYRTNLFTVKVSLQVHINEILVLKRPIALSVLGLRTYSFEYIRQDKYFMLFRFTKIMCGCHKFLVDLKLLLSL